MNSIYVSLDAFFRNYATLFLQEKILLLSNAVSLSEFPSSSSPKSSSHFKAFIRDRG